MMSRSKDVNILLFVLFTAIIFMLAELRYLYFSPIRFNSYFLLGLLGTMACYSRYGWIIDELILDYLQPLLAKMFFKRSSLFKR
jgi:hypothetical protein